MKRVCVTETFFQLQSNTFCSTNDDMWNRMGLILFAIGSIYILFEVEKTVACKYSKICSFPSCLFFEDAVKCFVIYCNATFYLVLNFLVKCYTCKRPQPNMSCPNEGRGELKTCTDSKQVCYKYMVIKKFKDDPLYAEIGESRSKGCSGLALGGVNKSLHPGCQRLNEWADFCSCDEDRCNDEGKMDEYLTEKKSS